MLMSDAPFFTSPPPDGSDGVDFLGIRAVNLSLMVQAIPGINNVVSWIRPFSLIAWMVWRYERAVGSGELSEANADDFERFTEKVESLYVWSHQVGGINQGIPGMRQSQPAIDLASLSFRAFGQRTSATSLFAAVNYGPASKAPFGLGFIVSVSPGLYAVTPNGKALAEALDAHLRKCLSPPLYNVIADFKVTSASIEQARAIFPTWRFTESTDAEREVFASRLFQPDLFAGENCAQSTEVGARERTAFITLIRQCLLESGQALSVEQLRKQLCTSTRPTSGADEVPLEALLEARATWQVLQVRQAQRLSLETLFACSESAIWRGDASNSTEIAQSIVQSVEALAPGVANAVAPFQFAVGADIEQFFLLALQHFESVATDADGLYASMCVESAVDMFEAMRRLQEAARGANKAEDACARALVLLALVAVFAEHFSRTPMLHKYATHGAAFRVPLHIWAAFTGANRTASLTRLVTRIIETYVVSQHFAIAASRFADEKSRLRFTVDDAGLTSLLKVESDVLSPIVSQDRLATLLSLCAEVGLVMSRAEGNGYVYWVDR